MDWPGITMDDRLTFRGDALELLTEYLMKAMPLSANQGLLEYKIVPVRMDYGVDATGTKNGIKIVVQCKFRSNPLDLVHYADLARTFTQGVLMHGLVPKTKKSLWLVTTANDANHVCKEVLGGMLHVLGMSHLKKSLDGNKDFWQGLDASI